MKKGFTLIELLVVVAIIGLLSSVVISSLNVARAKGRDAKRLEDLRQIQIALELYRDDHGNYPSEASGSNGKIGEGAGLDSLLTPYISSLPVDPLGPGDAIHYYYYDARQACAGSPNIAVIFARTMEQQPGNGSKFCTSWGGEGGAGNSAAYHIVIGPSPDG